MATLNLRLGWIVIAAITAEVLGVLALVVLVMIFGPADPGPAQAFAERLGAWVGPISGFVLCLLGGFLVARSVASDQIWNGFAVGGAAAILDLTIVAVLGVPIQMLLVISNIGRLVGGTIGGWMASAARS